MSVDDAPRSYHSSTSSADDPYVTRPLQGPEHELGSQSPLTDGSRPRRSRGLLLLNALLVLLVLGVIGVGAGLYYLDKSYQGKIYPNVAIQGVPVGEMTQQQAETAMSAQHAAFLKQPITLTYGDRSWQPSADEVGIKFDVASAAQDAYRAGRGNGMLANVQEVKAIWDNGLDLPLHFSFDQTKLRAYVEKVTAGLDSAPVDATLRLDGVDVVTQPAQVGRQVLVDDTVRDMSDALTSLAPHSITLRTRELQPRLSDAAVADAQTRIAALLNGPLMLTVNDKPFTWSPQELAPMIDYARVPKDAGSDVIAVDVNRFQVSRRVRQLADATASNFVKPRLDWNGGNLKIIKPGEPGLALDQSAAVDKIVGDLGGPQRSLVLPLKLSQQITEANLKDLGIKELVSAGRSDFTGSAEYRIHNIGVGMNTLNGLLIAPGEEFSFNDNIGDIDGKNGYVQGYAIISNRTQLEFGGGICQDSTTMYRAAFWAGLPITERWGHSFYISWYDRYALADQGNGPGMDATIFTGGPDLKFVNDTGHWMLIQSYSNPKTGVAEVALYGTKPNRTVTLTQKVYNRVPAPSQPQYVFDPKMAAGARKQTDTARGGMTIDVYRLVTENGVQKDPELFRTTFKAWPNIFTYGAGGKPGTKPAATPVPTADPVVVPTTIDEQPPVPGAVEGAPTPVPAPEQPAPAPEQPAPAPEQPAPTPAPEQPAPAPEQPAPAPEQPAPPAPEQPAPQG